MTTAPCSERRKGIEWTRLYWAVVLLDPWEILGQGESSTRLRQVSGARSLLSGEPLSSPSSNWPLVLVKPCGAVPSTINSYQWWMLIRSTGSSVNVRAAASYTAFLMAIVRPAGPMIR